MIEVTSENFNTIYPNLERALKNANFIAIDTEFTGLNVDDIKNRLVYTFLNVRSSNISGSFNVISHTYLILVYLIL